MPTPPPGFPESLIAWAIDQLDRRADGLEPKDWFWVERGKHMRRAATFFAKRYGLPLPPKD